MTTFTIPTDAGFAWSINEDDTDSDELSIRHVSGHDINIIADNDCLRINVCKAGSEFLDAGIIVAIETTPISADHPKIFDICSEDVPTDKIRRCIDVIDTLGPDLVYAQDIATAEQVYVWLLEVKQDKERETL